MTGSPEQSHEAHPPQSIKPSSTKCKATDHRRSLKPEIHLSFRNPFTRKPRKQFPGDFDPEFIKPSILKRNADGHRRLGMPTTKTRKIQFTFQNSFAGRNVQGSNDAPKKPRNPSKKVWTFFRSKEEGRIEVVTRPIVTPSVSPRSEVPFKFFRIGKKTILNTQRNPILKLNGNDMIPFPSWSQMYIDGAPDRHFGHRWGRVFCRDFVDPVQRKPKSMRNLGKHQVMMSNRTHSCPDRG